jgi:glutathione S-transferase
VPAIRLETKPPKVIDDSLEIAEYFLAQYPALRAPAGQEAKHDILLRELHKLDYFAICFTATGAPVSANPRIQAETKTQERLNDESISPRYRDALNRKLQT